MDFKNIVATLASPLLLCPSCHQSSPKGLLCSVCTGYLVNLDSPCPTCGEPECDNQLCGQCLQKPPLWDELFIPWRFDGLTRHLIHQFKYHQDMSAGRALSDLWVTQLNDSQKPDALIDVPMFGQKLLKKGFNQADIICNHLSKRLDIPRWKGIARTHATPPLEGLTKAERARAVKGAFEVIKKPPNSVAIIDDVFTTGSTVTEITHQLKRAGCQHVIIWALARTPLS